MVTLLMEIICNRSFTLTTGSEKQSRLRHLKNGVPQGSVLGLRLFNIYINDLPAIAARKFAYADDLAILLYTSNWQTLGGLLLKTGQAYPPTFLNGSSSSVQTKTKTVSAALHFYNKEARRELNTFVNKLALPFCAKPTYLGIKLDWELAFRRHLESPHKKLTFRVGLLKQLTGSSCSAYATVFPTATLVLVRFTAKYCAPV